MNAFTIWAREKKAEYLSRGIRADQLGSYLPKTWMLLNDKARHRYLMEAKHLRILHKMQHPEFYAAAGPKEKSESVPSSTSSHLVKQTVQGRSGARPAPGLIPLSTSTQGRITHHDNSNVSVISQLPRVNENSVIELPKRRPSNHSQGLVTQISSTLSNQSQGFRPQGSSGTNQNRAIMSKNQQSTEKGGTLDLSEIPSDAADVLGLALLSSGIQVKLYKIHFTFFIQNL